jgi:hypothetical protein
MNYAPWSVQHWGTEPLADGGNPWMEDQPITVQHKISWTYLNAQGGDWNPDFNIRFEQCNYEREGEMHWKMSLVINTGIHKRTMLLA